MRQTVLYGAGRQRLEQGKEYDVTADVAEKLVPRYAEHLTVATGGVDGSNGTGPTAAPDGIELENLTVPQLKEFAAEHGIELSASRKADIIAEIEAALGA